MTSSDSAAALSQESLFSVIQALQEVETLDELMRCLAPAIHEAVGYQTSWLYLKVSADVEDTRWRLVSRSTASGVDLTQVIELDSSADPFMTEAVKSRVPILIEDALLDSRMDQAIVQMMQNRSIVLLPLLLRDRPLGAMGMGTFGDEGTLLPTESQLRWLRLLSAQLASVVSRLQVVKERDALIKQRESMEARLFQASRLEVVRILTSGFAHDFNNALSSVLAHTQLLQLECEAAPAMLPKLESIERIVLSASKLVKRLVSVGQAGSGITPGVDVVTLVEQVVQMVRRSSPEGVRVDFTCEGLIPTLCVDATLLEQGLLNLGLNAADAIDAEGSVRFVLRYERGVLWVEVCDTGVGMDPQLQARVFEPFFTTKETGTGLGLPMVLTSVHAQGGEVHLKSALGEGSCFTITLPARESIASEPPCC